MKYHYLILNKTLGLWRVLHLDYPLSAKEAATYLRGLADDIVEITDPKEPRSLVVNQKN